MKILSQDDIIFEDVVSMDPVLDVPYVPTPANVVKRMLAIANLRPGEIVFDLGAGDGRILFEAQKVFGAQCVGVEIHYERVDEIQKRVRRFGLSESIRLIRDSFYHVKLSPADVVTMYLLPSVNEKLRPKLESELRPGTRVVAHDFRVPGWKADNTESIDEDGHRHMLYLYTMPRIATGWNKM